VQQQQQKKRVAKPYSEEGIPNYPMDSNIVQQREPMNHALFGWILRTQQHYYLNSECFGQVLLDMLDEWRTYSLFFILAPKPPGPARGPSFSLEAACLRSTTPPEPLLLPALSCNNNKSTTEVAHLEILRVEIQKNQ
jgi:hypothetical protein